MGDKSAANKPKGLEEFSRTLDEKIGCLAQSPEYRIYLDVRKRVTAMMNQASRDGALPSKYWQEEIEGFDYMFDASPLIVAKLREHCYHITGIRSYEYRQHHAHAIPTFAAKLQALRARDPRGLFIPEAPELGGYGHDIDGQLVNIDTLKFYESLIAMERGGVLAELRLRRSVAVEIGGGWGGFAYQMKKAIPNMTYVIVDLPATILFSATYIRALFPEAKCFFYESDPATYLKDGLLEYDFVFLPHYAFPSVELPQVDLGINMVSFQEMTTEQVSAYLERFVDLRCPAFYSHNRDRSKHNSELLAVGALLKRFYRLEEVEVLPVPYTSLALGVNSSKSRTPRIANLVTFLRESVRRLFKASTATHKSKKYSHLDYRHLVGRRNTRSPFHA